MQKDDLIVITGAGGFIGGALVQYFLDKGFTHIRAVDIKPAEAWYQRHEQAENLADCDLQEKENCYKAAQGAKEIYNLAADMGGMGFIETHKAECMLSVLINTHMLMAARDTAPELERYFYASSACAYNVNKQKGDANTDVSLKEDDAYPAQPEDGYGWEKLFSERMCRHFREDYGIETRIARFHNVYGPFGTWDGGREKAPAAICRKVINAKETGNHDMEIWGDGKQKRSFMYIDDCTYGIDLIAHSDILEPINLGSSELVDINELVDMAEEFAGIEVNRQYNLDAPTGVRSRNSDNTLIQQKLGWEPSVPLREGLRTTFDWIYDQYLARARGEKVVAD
jgi:nucleoside-diphosphate-sugar epimerase